MAADKSQAESAEVVVDETVTEPGTLYAATEAAPAVEPVQNSGVYSSPLMTNEALAAAEAEAEAAADDTARKPRVDAASE